MAYISGTAGSVAFVSGGTALLTGAYSWSLDISQNMPETTVFGDSWKTYLPGIREWTATVDLIKDPAQAVQGSVHAMIIGGSAAAVFRFYESGTVYAGSALVSGISPEVSYDDRAIISYDLTGSGPLTFS
jgi:hypothetical protein